MVKGVGKTQCAFSDDAFERREQHGGGLSSPMAEEGVTTSGSTRQRRRVKDYVEPIRP
jgi:hypothetical protein